MRLPRMQRHARVEMLPLMDVIFLILLFLIYAILMMVVHRGLPVSLPTSTAAQLEQAPALALTIQQDGALWLDREGVDLNSLPAAILSKSGEEGEPSLRIFADAALPYQKLFTVLDILKKAGLKKISLQAITKE